MKPVLRQALAGMLFCICLPTVAAAGVGLSTLLEARAAATRGVNLLLTRQRADGSWAGDPAATAQALICLANTPGREADPRVATACARAAEALRTSAAAALSPPTGSPADGSAGVLAAILPALARAGFREHQARLTAGRARLLVLAVPVELADGTRAMGFAPSAGFPADVRLSCAVVDTLLLTDGLAADRDPARYRGLKGYLNERLAALLPRQAVPAGERAGDSARAVPADLQVEVALLARALFCLGASSAERPLAEALARLAAAPPREPLAAFALAEALTFAEAAPTPALAGRLGAWPDRVIEALLGTQMGDGGWPAGRATEPRDLATALALRAIQVAAGRHLAEETATSP